MRISTVLGATLAASAGFLGISHPVGLAIQLADGTVYFAQPPRLVEASTTFRSIYAWGATYFFTLDLPENAGEPLQRITIALQEGGENPRYLLSESLAFEGTRWQEGAKVNLGEVTTDPSSKTVSVVFNPPVSPGKTVTIGLRPVQNPGRRGVYLFGVTAFPPGEKAHGQFLGFGRLTFTGHRGG